MLDATGCGLFAYNRRNVRIRTQRQSFYGAKIRITLRGHAFALPAPMSVAEDAMLHAPRSSPQWHAEVVERRAHIPTDDHERFVGYAVLGQRFRSGHVLALRRWPATSIGPAYTSVWHQLPDGRWRLYADAPAAQSCARYIDSATSSSWEGRIRLAWSDPYRLCVDVRGVGLEWNIDFRRTWITRAFTAARAVLPDAALAADPMSRALEWMARAGLGVTGLSGVMPNGHNYRALPRRIWLMDDARAWLNGVNLGPPQRGAVGARIGTLTVPTCGALAFVSARFTRPPLRESYFA